MREIAQEFMGGDDSNTFMILPCLTGQGLVGKSKLQ